MGSKDYLRDEERKLCFTPGGRPFIIVRQNWTREWRFGEWLGSWIKETEEYLDQNARLVFDHFQGKLFALEERIKKLEASELSK